MWLRFLTSKMTEILKSNERETLEDSGIEETDVSVDSFYFHKTRCDDCGHVVSHKRVMYSNGSRADFCMGCGAKYSVEEDEQ